MNPCCLSVPFILHTYAEMLSLTHSSQPHTSSVSHSHTHPHPSLAHSAHRTLRRGQMPAPLTPVLSPTHSHSHVSTFAHFYTPTQSNLPTAGVDFFINHSFTHLFAHSHTHTHTHTHTHSLHIVQHVAQAKESLSLYSH